MTPLLEAVPEADRHVVVARLRPRRFDRGEVVFNEGDVGDALYIVRSGRFDVCTTSADGQVMLLRVVHPDELFGELALVQPDVRRSARVCALEPSETLVLRRTDFEEARTRHPGIDRFLVAALAERLRRTTELAAEMMLPAEARIWRRLAVFADAYGDAPIRMSQDLLAQSAGTVRQTANRVLRAGARDGVLAVERGVIRILDRDALTRLVGR